jgi:hypothetical protein
MAVKIMDIGEDGSLKAFVPKPYEHPGDKQASLAEFQDSVLHMRAQYEAALEKRGWRKVNGRMVPPTKATPRVQASIARIEAKRDAQRDPLCRRYYELCLVGWQQHLARLG